MDRKDGFRSRLGKFFLYPKKGIGTGSSGGRVGVKRWQSSIKLFARNVHAIAPGMFSLIDIQRNDINVVPFENGRGQVAGAIGHNVNVHRYSFLAKKDHNCRYYIGDSGFVKIFLTLI